MLVGNKYERADYRLQPNKDQGFMMSELINFYLDLDKRGGNKNECNFFVFNFMFLY